MLAELLEALDPQLAAAPDTEALILDNCPDASALAQAEAAMAALPHGRMRYVHVPRPGVVEARNAGVAAAYAPYILFLDDDEVPVPGWLDSFRAMADGRAAMVFGRILARYETPPAPALHPLLNTTYSRDLPAAQGADITAHIAYLGTGNAMFLKSACLAAEPPFDPYFNRIGGEDIWMIRQAVACGARALWNPVGLVDELVPATRATMTSLSSRKFHQGRQRCLFLARERGLRARAELGLWMGVGALQLAGYATLTAIHRLTGSARATEYAVRQRSGLGKLLWWRSDEQARYAS